MPASWSNPQSGVEADMAGAVVLGAGAGDEQGFGAGLDCGFRKVARPRHVHQRQVAGIEQAAGIRRAKIQDRPVVRVGHAVGEIHIVAMLGLLQRLVGESVEDELGLEAEQVERLGPILPYGGAGGQPVLALHDLVSVLGAKRRVRLERQVIGHHLMLARRQGRLVEHFHLAAGLGIRVGEKPVRRLHDVGIGVVDNPSFGIGHGLDSYR